MIHPPFWAIIRRATARATSSWISSAVRGAPPCRTVGTVTHKLKVANNDSLELYEYPGGYASRFDGISKSGGDQAANLQHE